MPITKIIATLGPASGKEKILSQMIKNGLDVVRLNFSHGTHAQHLKFINLVRSLNKKLGSNIKILQDLEGPRIRVGKLPNDIPIMLEKGHDLWLTQKKEKYGKRIIPFDYEGSIQSLKGAKFIYIDDGNIVLEIKKLEKQRVKTQIIVGGKLKSFKGINIPDAPLEFATFSQKDEDDLFFGIKHKVDYIAQSFIRNVKDIEEVRKRLKSKGANMPIVSKIETQEAIKNIDAIIKASDIIMVARGDMGVLLPIQEIGILQKQIIKKCNQQKKPVITATQMLESMTEHTHPTRAEVTDVTNAILDGTDYVMLSGETAAGKYPAETVKMMDDIICVAEEAKKKGAI